MSRIPPKKNKLRILLAYHSLGGFGGAEKHIIELGNELVRRNHNVFLMVSELSKENEERLDKKINPIFINFSRRNFFLNMVKIIHIIKNLNIDIIHSHSRLTTVHFLLARKILKKKILETCHILAEGYKTISWRADLIIAVSERVKDHLMSEFKVDKEKIKVVYNGIDLDEYDLNFSKRTLLQFKGSLNIKNDNIVVSSIARLVPGKRQDFLILMIASILKRNLPLRNSLKVFIVGEGDDDYRAYLNSLIIRHKLDSNVFLLGILEPEEIKKMLYVSDLLVLPSKSEGFPYVVLEALALNTPVIAFDVGGISEVVKSGINGVLVKPYREYEMERVLEELLKNEKLRQGLSQNTRESVVKFSKERMVDLIEETYFRILAS